MQFTIISSLTGERLAATENILAIAQLLDDIHARYTGALSIRVGPSKPKGRLTVETPAVDLFAVAKAEYAEFLAGNSAHSGSEESRLGGLTHG